MKHAPLGYECPFCDIAASLSGPNVNSAIVFADTNLFVVIPLHYYGGIKGNCLVVPRSHYENALEVPDSLGNHFFSATRRLANAMLRALPCEGISTRQHNGPAGDQDVWHYHQHVIPRYSGDGLHAGHKGVYTAKERVELAARLRAELL